MPDGFFAESLLISEPPTPTVPLCGLCGLYRRCNSPKMAYQGQGRLSVLIVDDAPTAIDDGEGSWMSSPAGRWFKDILKYGPKVKLERDCWVTGALICKTKNGANPTSAQLASCTPSLLNTITETQPNVIIPMGKAAMQVMAPLIWKKDAGTMEKWAGRQIPSQALNAWVCPVDHPSFVMDAENRVIELAFVEQLKAAFTHTTEPWEEVPDYRSMVKIIYDDKEAAIIIDEMVASDPLLTAFDFETNMLSPDSPDSRIVSCSIATLHGGEAYPQVIAFPWHGWARPAVNRYVRSPLRKVASNLKFEERWVKAKCNTKVENWYWDTMLAAHVLDNRKGTKSIKFQSLVHLGVKSYNEHIEQFLSTPGKNTSKTTPNQIDRIDLEDLLLYNGLDSLLELLVCKEQHHAMCKGVV